MAGDLVGSVFYSQQKHILKNRTPKYIEIRGGSHLLSSLVHPSHNIVRNPSHNYFGI